MGKRYSPVRRDLYLGRELVRKNRSVVRKGLRLSKLSRVSVAVRRLNRGK